MGIFLFDCPARVCAWDNLPCLGLAGRALLSVKSDGELQLTCRGLQGWAMGWSEWFLGATAAEYPRSRLQKVEGLNLLSAIVTCWAFGCRNI